MPEVSVIMIFLNPGIFFKEAIESVRAQSFGDWELLLIDDGSSDGSDKLAQQSASAYPDHVCYFAHPERRNRGMSASRNLGLQQSRGRFIAFLDSDDVWNPNYLSSQIEILANSPEASASFADTLIWYSWMKDPAFSNSDRNRQYGSLRDQIVRPGDLIPLWLTRKEPTPATCSILIRSEAARKHMFEERFRGMFEDQAFLYKVALHETVFVSGKVLAYYRQHADSACQAAQRAGSYNPDLPNAAELRFLAWFKAYLNRQDDHSDAVQLALKLCIKTHRSRTVEHLWYTCKRSVRSALGGRLVLDR